MPQFNYREDKAELLMKLIKTNSHFVEQHDKIMRIYLCHALWDHLKIETPPKHLTNSRPVGQELIDISDKYIKAHPEHWQAITTMFERKLLLWCVMECTMQWDIARSSIEQDLVDNCHGFPHDGYITYHAACEVEEMIADGMFPSHEEPAKAVENGLKVMRHFETLTKLFQQDLDKYAAAELSDE